MKELMHSKNHCCEIKALQEGKLRRYWRRVAMQYCKTMAVVLGSLQIFFGELGQLGGLGSRLPDTSWWMERFATTALPRTYFLSTPERSALFSLSLGNGCGLYPWSMGNNSGQFPCNIGNDGGQFPWNIGNDGGQFPWNIGNDGGQFPWNIGNDGGQFPWNIGNDGGHFPWNIGNDGGHFPWNIGNDGGLSYLYNLGDALVRCGLFPSILDIGNCLFHFSITWQWKLSISL